MHSSSAPDRPLSLQELSTVREDSKARFESTKIILQLGSNEQKAAAMNSVMQFASKEIFAYAEKSPALRTFFTMDEKMQTELSNRLKRWNCPYEEINSMDKKIQVKILDLFLGAVIMTELNKCENYYQQKQESMPRFAIEMVNKACELNSFHAIDLRIKLNIERFNATLHDGYDKSEKIVDFILLDIKRLTNVYWSLGSVVSAYALLQLAIAYTTLPGAVHAKEVFDADQYFNDKLNALKQITKKVMSDTKVSSANKLQQIDIELKQHTEKVTAPKYIVLIEQMMELQWSGILLATHPTSNKIASAIYPESGLAGWADPEWATWEKSEEQIAKKLTKHFGIKKPEIFFEVMRKMTTITLALAGYKTKIATAAALSVKK